MRKITRRHQLAKYVRVASISFKGAGRRKTLYETIEGNMKEIMHLLRKAVLEKPDIICLPECSPFLGLSIKEMIESTEEVSRAILDKVSSFAKENSTFIIFPMVEKRNNRFYNSAILIGKHGEYIGSYDKIHPTIWEIEAGITPGVEVKTFDLDFGKIGFAICFDLNFEDVIKNLAKDKIKLMFFPSMYLGGLQLKIWAFNYSTYVVSSTTEEGSMIVNPLGKVLVVSNRYQPVICKEINLDYEILHLDYNSEKMDLIKEKYGSNITFEVAQPEAVFLMSSEMSKITVKDVIEEFKLETREEYFKKASVLREKALKS
ncbi:MAG: carbon-nitrogen hydrolase family protein [Thermoproteota archaeon]|nr:carbon-nitrogen hydrolase family protein [Candidatus Brockarchaeota archaeon]